MGPAEKLVVLATYIGQVLFVPIVMWAVTRPQPELEVLQWSRPIALVLTPLSLAALIVLFRDLYKRQFHNKGVWVAAVLLSGGIAIIPYTFIHAFRPRIQHERV